VDHAAAGRTKADSQQVWLATASASAFLWIAFFAITLVLFRKSKFPKEVGLQLYFNMFCLNSLMQLPGALITGMYLLRVQFQRSLFGKAESLKIAQQYILASFVVGLFQSFIVGYLFTMVINYYTLFLVFGLPTSSNATLVIDIAVIWAIVRVLKCLAKETVADADSIPLPDVTGGIDIPLVSFLFL
jgi:hypothetical protein